MGVKRETRWIYPRVIPPGGNVYGDGKEGWHATPNTTGRGCRRSRRTDSLHSVFRVPYTLILSHRVTDRTVIWVAEHAPEIKDESGRFVQGVIDSHRTVMQRKAMKR
jgi:hypothetical protein